jgi:hypothetical protein
MELAFSLPLSFIILSLLELFSDGFSSFSFLFFSISHSFSFSFSFPFPFFRFSFFFFHFPSLSSFKKVLTSKMIPTLHPSCYPYSTIRLYTNQKETLSKQTTNRKITIQRNANRNTKSSCASAHNRRTTNLPNYDAPPPPPPNLPPPSGLRGLPVGGGKCNTEK